MFRITNGWLTELLRLVTVKLNFRFTPSLMGEDHSTLREFTPFSIRVTSVLWLVKGRAIARLFWVCVYQQEVLYSGTSDKRTHNRNNLRTKNKVQCTKWRLSYCSNTIILNLDPIKEYRQQRTKWPENNGSQTVSVIRKFTWGHLSSPFRV